MTWQKCFSLHVHPPAVLSLFLAEVTRPGPGCHWWPGCTRTLHKQLLMLLFWLGATLAYSPKCLSEVPAGDHGILPFAYLLLSRPRAAAWLGRLRFSCTGWSCPAEGRPCSHKGTASCVLEGPCAFEWLQHTRAVLHGLVRGAKRRGCYRQGGTHRCFVTATQTWCLSR